MLTGLSQLNVELTSRCDKHTLCFMCGHQSDKDNPHLQRGDMDFALLEEICAQIEPPIIISLHRDGDPLAYDQLAGALRLFHQRGHPVSVVTHGEALGKRARDIIGMATTVTVSVISSDPDREIQLASLREFIAQKGALAPMLQLKFVGTIEDPEPYEKLGVPIIGRALHHRKGDWNYHRVEPPVPEVRVCLDFLGKPTVDWRGKVYACNRLDPNEDGLIGDLNEQTLDEIWNGPKRGAMLRAHLAGRRDLANPLCAACEYYGLPAAL